MNALITVDNLSQQRLCTEIAAPGRTVSVVLLDYEGLKNRPSTAKTGASPFSQSPALKLAGVPIFSRSGDKSRDWRLASTSMFLDVAAISE